MCRDNEKGVDIIIPIFIGGIDTLLDADRISYILIQVKNLQKDKSDNICLASATTALSPSRVGIEDLPHMPFLSLYMQLRSPKARVEFPDIKILQNQTRGSQEATLRIQGADLHGVYLSREAFLGQVRQYPHRDATASEVSAFRNHFQTAICLFGLGPDVYGCLKYRESDLAIIMKKLLVTTMDVMGEFTDEDDKHSIIRMLPLQYRLC